MMYYLAQSLEDVGRSGIPCELMEGSADGEGGREVIGRERPSIFRHIDVKVLII